MDLFWHRRDLRTTDNRGLAAAQGPPLPVFVFDPGVLEHASPPRVSFLLDALEALFSRYRALGGDLLLEHGDPRDVLPRLASEHDADRVVWNADHSGLAQTRDEAVREALESRGVEVSVEADALLHEPGSVRTNAGDPYQVYTPFSNKWFDRSKDGPVAEPGAVASAEAGHIPPMADLGFDEPTADLPAAGPGPARDRLEAFCEGPIFDYAEDRDVPARDGTSRLSADLHFGTIGIRTVWAATEDAMGRAREEAQQASVRAYQSQLAWREFYAHVLYFNPETVTEHYADFGGPIAWRDDPDGLAAWKAGETGYPIVDAGMRQLAEAAWMHNRVRMIVASFLTKDLLIDWREGYRHFREHLVDHDTANDVGGWQWAASTGTDAQPYFRIFNPTTQGERYDPDATYIRAHVPELRGVEPTTIHDWPELTDAEREDVAPDYPAPIVDHGERRELAIETFQAARGD